MQPTVIEGIGTWPILDDLVPEQATDAATADLQRAIPSLAKSPEFTSKIEQLVRQLPTRHKIFAGDSRSLDQLEEESVHLVLTSPPYWTLKRYPERDGQLGLVEQYDDFLDQLRQVWQHVFRVLVPGGRLVVVVGDVCLSRRQFGRHVVFPLHAGIQESCRTLGFDNLSPIIWYKISNAQYEVENGSRFLGKPYEPNAIIKNDIEFILFQRKPGGYRKPSFASRIFSLIPEVEYSDWFQQVWRLGGASTRHHPAPFPLKLAERIVRMYSFVGDTVVDPFMGTGTTNVAAQAWGRHSIGIDIEPKYVDMALNRLRRSVTKQAPLFS